MPNDLDMADDIDKRVHDLIRRNPRKVVATYADNFDIRRSEIDASHVLHHWTLERALTRRILSSTPRTRAQVVSEVYSTLYSECPWLLSRRSAPSPQQYCYLPYLLNKTDKIFEIGSGEGHLVNYLRAQGYDCTGSDITSARIGDNDTLAFQTYDASGADQISNYSLYDCVLSFQMIEHLHADDISSHFDAVFRLLKLGGRYIFNTPHRYSGPADLSRVFGLDTACCLHLREYTYSDLTEKLRSAGFTELKAVYVAPQRLRRFVARPLSAASLLRCFLASEAVLENISPALRKRIITTLSRVAIWRPDVFMIAAR